MGSSIICAVLQDNPFLTRSDKNQDVPTTEDAQRLEHFDLGCRGMVLSMYEGCPRKS